MKKVNRVEQQIIKRNNSIYKIVDQYCFYSKNVYNQANYIIRQEFINNKNKIGAYDVQKLMQSMDCYKECGSQAAQKTIQLVDKMWKGYFVAIKDWKKNPSKYLGMPKLPKYLPKDGRQVFMLKNRQCSLNDRQFRIAFKPFGGYTVNTHAEGKLMQCRFVPKADYYVMEIVYEIEVPETENIVSERLADELNLRYVQTFYDGEFISWEHCMSFMHKSDIAVNIPEGIVVKNQTELNNPNSRTPFVLKIVNSQFSEIKKDNHRQKVENPQKLAAKAKASEIVEQIVTKNRVQKELYKMIDEGILPQKIEPQDMRIVAQNLPKRIFEDCVKEEKELVVEAGEFFGKMCGSATMNWAKKIIFGE